MSMDEVQLRARGKGELVYAMRQKDTVMSREPGPWGDIRRGFCAGLAMRWIWLRYGDRDYAFDPASLELDLPDWEATRDQNILLDIHTAHKFELNQWRELYDKMAQASGMSLNKGRTLERHLTATGEMLRHAAEAGTGCYLINMYGASGHAVAMQRESGDVFRFFDANRGEFILRGGQRFTGFMDEYMTEVYKGRFSGLTCVAFINPPSRPPS